VTKELNYELGEQRKVWNRRKQDKEKCWVATLFHPMLSNKCVGKLGLLSGVACL